MLNKLVAALLLTTFLSACAPRTAVFLSEPPGAQVFIDGEPIGQTPCDYRYPLGAGGDFQVMVEMPGFEAVAHTIRADETDVSARNRWLAAGVIWSPLWLGALFTKKLKDGYEFVLRQEAPLFTARTQAMEEPRLR